MTLIFCVRLKSTVTQWSSPPIRYVLFSPDMCLSYRRHAALIILLFENCMIHRDAYVLISLHVHRFHSHKLIDYTSIAGLHPHALPR